MRPSDALWQIFAATGHIGIYLLYKRQRDYELRACGQETQGEVFIEQPSSITG
ncbi:hypothetical protein SAMN00808754_0763 [Thermanaeromonas toyohensis ToBE]|uniref:YqzL-like protein n=1 Tax=Thermanaeromonas toyohensis ToBE TaxID=698762 RepID=A0A1W1VIX7_9FIRM|nr:hypothetical protein [Thermanaeromonas toyohensis]SMB93001.1 hypothetical protein SAMN00808754_0763 [Thermanaeromonas toyohensis ToBE]